MTTMKQFLFFTIIFFSNRSTAVLNIEPNSYDNCSIYSDDFWFVYDSHFLLVDTLTFVLLQTKDHRFELNKFTETLLSVMGEFDFPVALKIQETFLVFKSKKRLFDNTSDYDDINFGRVDDIKPVDDEEFSQIKVISTDSIKGYVITVWDFETLHQFLDTKHGVIIPEARATYALESFLNHVMTSLHRSIEL